MKIIDVAAIPVTAVHAHGSVPYCFVRIETDTGLVGVGEATDGVGCRYAATLSTLVDEALIPVLLDADPLAVEPLVHRMRSWTRRRLGDEGIVIQAISAVELALWDLAGQSLGVSISELFGRFRDEIAVCAVGGELVDGEPSETLDRLRPCLDRGVRLVKVRFGTDMRAALETLTALRGLLDPAVGIAVDGGGRLTAPDALGVATRLADLGIAWFEHPVPQHHRAAIRHIAERSPVPVAPGAHLYTTHGVQSLLDEAPVSVLHPDASIGGGLAEVRRMAAVAEHYGVRVVPRAAAGPVALAANLHVAAFVPQARVFEYPYQLADFWELVSPGCAFGPAELVDGRLRVPTAPGLGLTLDMPTVAAHRSASSPEGDEPAGVAATGAR